LTPPEAPPYIYLPIARRPQGLPSRGNITVPEQPEPGVAPDAEPACADLLSTGDMARLTGSTLRTVRFYEQEGLLEPATRNGGGHRLFSRDQLEKLQLILDLREAGLSLHEIRDLLELKQGCPTAEAASERLTCVLERQLECMQHKINLLRRLRDELASTVSAINDCRSCNDAKFPHRCDECDVLQQPEHPRALRVLWDT
jgi:DNA-binding transcriptional MerR regulator